MSTENMNTFIQELTISSCAFSRISKTLSRMVWHGKYGKSMFGTCACGKSIRMNEFRCEKIDPSGANVLNNLAPACLKAYNCAKPTKTQLVRLPPEPSKAQPEIAKPQLIVPTILSICMTSPMIQYLKTLSSKTADQFPKLILDLRREISEIDVDLIAPARSFVELSRELGFVIRQISHWQKSEQQRKTETLLLQSSVSSAELALKTGKRPIDPSQLLTRMKKFLDKPVADHRSELAELRNKEEKLLIELENFKDYTRKCNKKIKFLPVLSLRLATLQLEILRKNHALLLITCDAHLLSDECLSDETEESLSESDSVYEDDQYAAYGPHENDSFSEDVDEDTEEDEEDEEDHDD
jgi:hypothetical protein